MQSKDQTFGSLFEQSQAGSNGALWDHKAVAVAVTVDQATGTILGYASLAQNSGCANQAGFIHETASAGILTINNGEVWMLSGHGHARADIVTVGGKMAQCKALTNDTAIKETAKRIAEGYYGKMDIVVPSDTYDALLAEGVPAGRMVKMPYSTDYVKSIALKMGHGYGSIGSKIATSASTGAMTGACFATAFSTAACAFEVSQGNMTLEKAAVEIVKSAAVAGVSGAVYNTAVTCTSLALKEMGCKAAAAAVPGIGTALM